jgi:glycosyltransferase involved in cell wall biosynthesis
MHIALVTAYPPSKGSLNEYGFHFAEALTAHPRVRKLSIIADTLPHAHADLTDIHRVWTFNDPRNAHTIQRTLDRLAPDAVIFNIQFASFGNTRIAASLALFSPWRSQRKRPTITLLHNIFETVDLKSAGFDTNPLLNTLTRGAGWLFTKVLLRSDLVGLTMPRYVEIIQQKYRAKNVFHSPHGAFATPKDIAPLPEVPTVMTFGKFGTYKKVEILLEAHAKLLRLDPDIHLVIAGSDSPNMEGYLASVQQRFAHLPNVRFTGYVAEEDVPTAFENSTVVAFPYESTTGSSGVLHQAGQFGRAAVMPLIGDLADLVKDEGYQANFFTPGNVESLMEALWDLLSNRDKAAALGHLNHRAASGITLSDIAELYIQKLETLQEQRWKSQNSLANKGVSTT